MSRALVAAEVIAVGVGRPSRHLPTALAVWLREQDALFSPGVVALAAGAVQRVGKSSELREFFDKAGRSEEWLVGINGLYRRLHG